MKFGELEIGDMFNTMVARWVKTSDTEAICVMSGMVSIGQIQEFSPDVGVVALYSVHISSKLAATQFATIPSLVESLELMVSVGCEYYDMDCGENGSAAIEKARSALEMAAR